MPRERPSALESRVRATLVARLNDLLDATEECSSRLAFARQHNLPESTVYAWFSGSREPTLTGLLILTQAFGLGTIEELLGPLPSRALVEDRWPIRLPEPAA